MVISFRAVRAWSSWLTARPHPSLLAHAGVTSSAGAGKGRVGSACRPFARGADGDALDVPAQDLRNAAGLAAPLGEGRGRRQLGSGRWRPGVLTATIVMVILGINVDAQAKLAPDKGRGLQPRGGVQGAAFLDGEPEAEDGGSVGHGSRLSPGSGLWLQVRPARCRGPRPIGDGARPDLGLTEAPYI